MAGSANNTTEKDILNELLGAVAFVSDVTVWIALWTTMPTDAGGGVEVTGGAYVRFSVTNNTTNFPNATGDTPSTKNNGVAFTFVTATANWGTILGASIMTHVSASAETDFLCWFDLDTTKAVNTDDTAEFAINAITVTMD